MAREKLRRYNVTNWHLYTTPERRTHASVPPPAIQKWSTTEPMFHWK